MNPKENSDIHGETATSSDNTSQGAAMSPVSTSSETGTPASSQVLVPNMDASGKPLDVQQPQLLFKKCEMRMLFQIDHTRINPQCRGKPDVTMVGTTADATSPPTSSMCTSSISTIEGSPKNVEGYTPSTSAVTKTSETTQVLVPNMDASGKPPDNQQSQLLFEMCEMKMLFPVDYTLIDPQCRGKPDVTMVGTSAYATSPPISNAPPLNTRLTFPPTTERVKFCELDLINVGEEQCEEAVSVIVANQWLRMYKNKLYMLQDGIYVPFNAVFMRQAVFKLIMSLFGGEPKRSSICDHILNEAKFRASPFNGKPNDEQYTYFRNGFFDNTNGSFTLDIEDYFHTIRVEADFLGFDEPLNHPETDRFFETIAGGDSVKIKLLWQCLGYSLVSDARGKAIFILWGPKGDNGKSTYLSFIQSFLTSNGVRNLSMKNLLGGRFAISELEFARINVSADEGAVDLNTEAIGRLKAISGHDIINSDVKNKEQTRFLCTCKLLIASNNNIGVAYTASDPAFERRLVTIPFEVSIPKEQQDPYLLDKLENERDAVATEAMKYYLELKANNYRFSGREQFNNMLHFAPSSEEYDLIRNFSECYCDFSDSEAFIATQDLYTAFCNVHGNVFKDDTAFSQAFKRYNVDKVDKVKKHTSASNCWGYIGVTLKEAL